VAALNEKRPSRIGLHFLDVTSKRLYVFMIFRPTLRFLTGPFPPGFFAARFFAAVILPPLLFFAIVSFPPSLLEMNAVAWQVGQTSPGGIYQLPARGGYCQ
jgi:hypothetical protein